MKQIINITALFLGITLSCSCVKEQLEINYNSQESQIDSYISAELMDTTLTATYNKGSARLTRVAGEGEALTENGTVAMYYAGYIFTGNISPSDLFTTNHEQTAQDAKWFLTDLDTELWTINLKETDLVTGLRNGLIGVKGGEECEILFTGKYGFGNSPFGTIPANSALAYKVWVVSVSNE